MVGKVRSRMAGHSLQRWRSLGWLRILVLFSVLSMNTSTNCGVLAFSPSSSIIPYHTQSRIQGIGYSNYAVRFRSHQPLWSTQTTSLERPSSLTQPVTSIELDPAQFLSEETLAQIYELVEARGKARWEGNYDRADDLKTNLLQIHIPTGLELFLEDLPRSDGGGSVWKLLYASPNEQDVIAQQQQQSSSVSSEESPPSSSVLQLAHAALGWAVSCAKTMVPFRMKQKQLDIFVDEAKRSLRDWKAIQQQLASQQQQEQPTPSQAIATTPSSMLIPFIATSTNIGNQQKDAEDTLQLTTATTATDNSNAPGWVSIETTLRGRKAADAAVWFALAGVTDPELLDLLALVCTKELHRFGVKPTCRSKDIYQIMGRFAAAGLRSGDHPELEAIAQHCLVTKQPETNEPEGDVDGDSLSLLELHSDRSLLMLWKFAARQKKQQSFLQSAQKHWEKQTLQTGNDIDIDVTSSDVDTMLPFKQNADEQTKATVFSWYDRFEDPTKPLVLDIGCGMGISLLGLANPLSNISKATDKPHHQDSTDSMIMKADEFQNCNLLGVDLSGLAIGYAQGVAARWGLSHRLQFEVDTAEALLEQVRDSYPGIVQLCLIQFPTPYRLPSSGGNSDDAEASSSGNSQLPTSALEGFMVSPKLLQLLRQVLSSNKNKANRNEASMGKLLLQSNCEDVALWMQQTAVAEGFQSVATAKPVDRAHDHDLPQRTENWIAMGGERAVGPSWSATSILPPKGSTETEVACRINGTPIHRCVLLPID